MTFFAGMQEAAWNLKGLSIRNSREARSQEFFAARAKKVQLQCTKETREKERFGSGPSRAEPSRQLLSGDEALLAFRQIQILLQFARNSLILPN